LEPQQQHSSSWILPKSSLVVKRKGLLFEWRNRIVEFIKDNDTHPNYSNGKDTAVIFKILPFTNRIFGDIPQRHRSTTWDFEATVRAVLANCTSDIRTKMSHLADGEKDISASHGPIRYF
jgi:hypothetical protein